MSRRQLLVARSAVQSAAAATRSSSTMPANGRQELPSPAEVRKKYVETVGKNRASCCQGSCAERSCGDRSKQHDGCRWPRSFDHVVIRVVYELPSPGPSTECWSAARVHPVQERLHESMRMGVKAVGLTRAG